MNSMRPRNLVYLMLFIILIFVCAACSNVQHTQKVEEGLVTGTQDDLVTNVIDAAKPTQSSKERAAEEADKEQSVTQAIDTEEAHSKETVAKQASLGVETEVVAPVEAAPASKPTVMKPTVKTTSEDTDEASVPSTITISITSDEKKGVILEPTSIQWEDGDSVLDVLKQVTKKNKITLEYKGVGMLSYVEGIDNLYEFDQGTNSGWLFRINGKYATRSAGAVKLSIGDNVEWIYSIKKDEDLDE